MGHDTHGRLRVSLVDPGLQSCPAILGTVHRRYGLRQHAPVPPATRGVGAWSGGVLDPGAGEFIDRGPPCFWSIRECVSPPVCVRDDACFIHRLIDVSSCSLYSLSACGRFPPYFSNVTGTVHAADIHRSLHVDADGRSGEYDFAPFGPLHARSFDGNPKRHTKTKRLESAPSKAAMLLRSSDVD